MFMKLVLAMALFLGTAAFADEAFETNQTPFQMPEGTYDMTCVSGSYGKVDGKEVRSSDADEGVHSVRYVGNTIIMETRTKPMGVNSKVEFHDLTTIVRDSLGDSKYRDTATSSGTFTDPDGQVYNFNTKWARTFKVDGSFEINLTVKQGDDAEKAAVGENSWIKVSDKVFIESGYQRGPTTRTTEDGKVRETISSFSSCTHKLK
jgi:hypothetical protein